MLVPLNKNRTCTTANALPMQNDRLRAEHDIPSEFFEFHTQIQILAVQEKTFVESTHLFECGALNHHARTGNRIHLDRKEGRCGRFHVKIMPAQNPPQTKRPNERFPRRGNTPPPPALLGSIGV